MTGQRRMSDLATKRHGLIAEMTKMSSQETWFATTTPRRGLMPGGSPRTESWTPRMRSSSSDQRRITRARAPASSFGYWNVTRTSPAAK